MNSMICITYYTYAAFSVKKKTGDFSPDNFLIHDFHVLYFRITCTMWSDFHMIHIFGSKFYGINIIAFVC